ncbi:hypothetical protein VNO77_50909 [Canavalia gladiata]|uniref:Uncharacterized protein n=1 Tax=Canavalia gladiata TaxID=3824 RepID=A0AAN9PFX4_CANGL
MISRVSLEKGRARQSPKKEIEYPEFADKPLRSNSFQPEVVKLGRRSGWLYVALYCKQASTCFMHYSSSTHPKRLTELSVPISLTRTGLPRIIPPFHRKGSRRKKGVQSVFRAFPFEIHSWFQLAESRNQFRGRQQANWLGALWFPWTRQVKSKERAIFQKVVPDSNQSTTGGKRAGSESSAQAVGVGLV